MKFFRFLSLFLVTTLLLTSCAFDYNGEMENEEVTLEYVDEMIYDKYGIPDVTSTDMGTIATLSVDGANVSCSYVNESDDYILSVDHNEYYLDVIIQDDVALVGFKEAMYDNNIYQNKVVGQSVSVAAFAYFSPAIIEAAVVVIEYLIGVVIVVSSTYYSVDLIATVIGNVKDGILSLPDTKPFWMSNSRWKALSKEMSKIETANKTGSKKYFYKAMLENNDVYISPEGISSTTAILRLQRGYDVFATTRAAAKTLGRSASPTRNIREDVGEWGEGYYPHVHPIGCKWYKAAKKNSWAHIWYPK